MNRTGTVPAGTRVVLDGGLRRREEGRLLVGGAPLRLLRLSPAGARAVDGWERGVPVGERPSERALARRLLDAGMAHPDPAPDPAAEVTVVIPVRDDAARLDRCLAGCGRHPVVVVDDGSSDAAAVRVVAERHGARLIRRETSGGPGAARAEALGGVDSALVAFVDVDVDTDGTWVESLAGHFADPVVAAAAPRVRSRSGPSVLERYEFDNSPLDLGAAPSPVGPGRRVAYVPTAAVVVRMAAVRAIGGFDPALRHGEDVDLVWRLVEHGHVVRYDPSVVVTHDPRDSWSSWLRQRRDYGTSAAPLGRRHGDAVAPARCSPWSAAGWAAVAVRRPVLGAAAMAGSGAALVRRLRSLEHPATEAARLAGAGHLWAGLGLAHAVTRAWWPIAATAAVIRPQLRPTLAAATLAPAAIGWLRGGRSLDPVRAVALSVVDDVAYGAGLWEGMVRHRTLRPITPDLGDWPGPRPAVERAAVD